MSSAPPAGTAPEAGLPRGTEPGAPGLPSGRAPASRAPSSDLASPATPEAADLPDLPEVAATSLPDTTVAPDLAPERPLAPPSVVVREETPSPRLPPEALPPVAEVRTLRGRGVSFVAASTAAISNGRLADGVGGSAGIVGDVAVARGVSLSGGALAAYNRFTIMPGRGAVADALTDASSAPGLDVDVPDRTALSTLAVEIPVDVAVHLVSTPRGRFGLAVGLTSAVYLAQTFEEEGQTYSAEVITSGNSDVVTLSSEAYASRETPGALSRVDLARQLNLALRFDAGRSPLAVEAYARLPLGGLTSQDLDLTTLGLRLRLALR